MERVKQARGEYRVTKLLNQMWAAGELSSTWSLFKAVRPQTSSEHHVGDCTL